MPHDLWVDIPGITGTSGMTAGFTTRMGGSSPPPFDSLNFSFYREDPASHVMENHARLADCLGIDHGRMVRAHQVHGSVCARVGAADAGIWSVAAARLEGVDALVTNEKGVLLLTTHADCVPLFFHDPERNAVGLAHAGWSGTLAGVAGATLRCMRESFGTDPAALKVTIGPHIRACCFEVGPEVEAAFGAHPLWEDEMSVRSESRVRINLAAFLRRELESFGVSGNHIVEMEVCTRCNADRFFSHRGSGGNTGCGAAFIGMEVGRAWE